MNRSKKSSWLHGVKGKYFGPKDSNSTVKSLTLFAITWPILIEQFLQTLMKFSDVLMLSFVSDEAVAAIGVVNQITVFTFVLFNFTAMGSGVVVAQFVGAKKPHDVSSTIANAVTINLLFGLVISSLIVIFRHPLLELFNLNASLMQYADIYMIIVGGALFAQAMVLTLSSVLQAQGYTKDVMLVILGMNVLNIIGNYLFIFGALGVPQLGVTGVAISTAVCRILAMCVLFLLIYHRVEMKFKIEQFIRLKKEYVKKILNIGVPAAGEHLAHNISQLTITVFITLMGAAALATKVYTQNLMMITAVFAMAISKGMQIFIGQLVGAGKLEEAYKEMFRGLRFALFFSLTGAIILAVAGKPVLGIFTDEQDIIKVAATLLVMGLLYEPGRTFNLVIISALRASGDAKFPVMMGIVSMWGICVPLAYILGVTLEFGLIGIWTAMIIDEWLRGMLMLFRWRSRKWQSKVLVEEVRKTA